MNLHDTFFTYWNELERAKDWIDLGMGMPPVSLFCPAVSSHEALIEGINLRADYQPQAGPLFLREAIAEYETKHTGIRYTSDNIMLIAGAIRGFSLIIDTLVNHSSKFVEISPTYPLLSGYIRHIANKFGNVVETIVPIDRENFLVYSNEILPFLNDSTILFFTNPSNPTGLYMPDETLESVINECERVGSYLVIDETCDIPLTNRGIKYPNKHERSLIRIQSFSKTLLLAGYRAGYIVADANLIDILSSHYSFSDANAPTVINRAIFDYIRRDKAITEIAEISQSKVDYTIERLSNMPNIQHIIVPEACYYIFLKINSHVGSWELFEHFLEAGVNVVPGALFGVNNQEPWIRIGCAHDDETLVSGLSRINHALLSLA